MDIGFCFLSDGNFYKIRVSIFTTKKIIKRNLNNFFFLWSFWFYQVQQFLQLVQFLFLPKRILAFQLVSLLLFFRAIISSDSSSTSKGSVIIGVETSSLAAMIFFQFNFDFFVCLFHFNRADSFVLNNFNQQEFLLLQF